MSQKSAGDLCAEGLLRTIGPSAFEPKGCWGHLARRQLSRKSSEELSANSPLRAFDRNAIGGKVLCGSVGRMQSTKRLLKSTFERLLGAHWRPLAQWSSEDFWPRSPQGPSAQWFVKRLSEVFSVSGRRATGPQGHLARSHLGRVYLGTFGPMAFRPMDAKSLQKDFWRPSAQMSLGTLGRNTFGNLPKRASACSAL